MPHRALVGVGSNLGDRSGNINEAIDKLLALPDTRIVRLSSFYESEPHGDAKTWFVNAALEIETEFKATDFLKKLKGIEEAMGRKRVKGKKWGARIMDLDILFFDQEIVNSRNLKIPHPRIAERRFVLLPLAEVAPQHNHPVLDQTVSQILATSKDTKRVTLLPPGA